MNNYLHTVLMPLDNRLVYITFDEPFAVVGFRYYYKGCALGNLVLASGVVFGEQQAVSSRLLVADVSALAYHPGLASASSVFSVPPLISLEMSGLSLALGFALGEFLPENIEQCAVVVLTASSVSPVLSFSFTGRQAPL